MKDDIKGYLSSVGVDWEEVDDLAAVRHPSLWLRPCGTCRCSALWLAELRAGLRRAGRPGSGARSYPSACAAEPTAAAALLQLLTPLLPSAGLLADNHAPGCLLSTVLLPGGG